MMRAILMATASAVVATATLAQTPQPFPRPGSPSPPAAAQPAPQPPPPAVTQIDPSTPTEATLGIPVYPAAQFIASYDAGRGQRYYLFGTTTPFADLVAYYRTVLKERGDEVFTQPQTHMFEVGRFREETMAFPPGVTIKDWTSGGSAGYPNPRPGAQPARFASIIMIVPPLPAAR